MKWQRVEITNLSIIERVDDFIEQPVDEIIRQIRAESDTERLSQPTSTPNPRDVEWPVPNYFVNIDFSNDEPGISETITNWDSDSSSTDASNSDDRFFRLYP